MIADTCLKHSTIESSLPLTVTARSVEPGSISLATWMLAPVSSRISLILLPPLPIMEPHWLAGTMSRRVIGGIELALHVCIKSSSNFLHIIENDLLTFSTSPLIVTMRSGVEPSDMVILAPLFKNSFTN